MNTQDFERLKNLCQENGFEIDGVMNNEGVYFIRKKDPWDGVEFFLGADGIIRKIPDEETLNILKKVKLLDATPSTEAAYIEQKIKEAFERFGEIREGDRFVSADGYRIGVEFNGYANECQYSKEIDALFIGGLRLYQSGKWATRVKERVEVELDYESFGNNNTYYFKTQVPVSEEKLTGSGEFLAKQLEEYLNKE